MPAILRCFRIAGFLFSKEGCYITQNEVNAVFDEQVRLCADTLKRKTKEYTGDDPDRLGAFKAAAALQHTTPQRALAGMLAKHIVSLYDMCFAEETVYPMDTWDEKITDSLLTCEIYIGLYNLCNFNVAISIILIVELMIDVVIGLKLFHNQSI